MFAFTNSAVKAQHVLFANELFLCKMLVSFLSSNIPLYIEETHVEELCKVLEVQGKIKINFMVIFTSMFYTLFKSKCVSSTLTFSTVQW